MNEQRAALYARSMRAHSTLGHLRAYAAWVCQVCARGNARMFAWNIKLLGGVRA
jgi:hypothetical protein